MKVCVYAISLNEDKFIEKWYESAKLADFILLADTGSTDKTVEIAKSLGITVQQITVKPWRFDVARNASLALIPDWIDYCIALDVDEVLLPGWRDSLQVAFDNGWTRPRYEYTWSWNADGTPGLQYSADKIHARNGYYWKHPAHEVIVPYLIEETQGWIDLKIHHHNDPTKSRSQYLNLLKLSVQEDPLDSRNAHYYARELFFDLKFDEAIQEFKRHLTLPTSIWKAERAQSMRYIAQCSNTFQEKEEWLLKAINEDEGRREALVDLAYLYYENEKWQLCLDYANRAINITQKPLDYICEDFAWSNVTYDIASIAAFKLNKIELAIEMVEKAIQFEPEDFRLINNLKLFKQFQ